jgi:hypothetical protein
VLQLAVYRFLAVFDRFLVIFNDTDLTFRDIVKVTIEQHSNKHHSIGQGKSCDVHTRFFFFWTNLVGTYLLV